MPGNRNLLSLDASLANPTRVLRFEDSGLRRRTPVRPVLLTCLTGTHRSDRSDPPVRPVWQCCSTVFGSSVLALWINQGTQWLSGEPPETTRIRCSLRQSPLMTRLPRSPSSTLFLRLNQETVHDFILLFMTPCGPHLTLLATRSLERSLLVFSTPGGLTGDDVSRLFFTCTNTSQVAACTCNTSPRISPHNVLNHSSHMEATIHRSLNHTWSSGLRRGYVKGGRRASF
jgi:hypothetical protein